MYQDTNCSFVEELMEDVVCPQGLFSLLFVAKDQIYPLVEVGGDIVTLQCLWVCVCVYVWDERLMIMKPGTSIVQNAKIYRDDET